MSKWASSVIRPTSSILPPRHGIIAPDEQGQRMGFGTRRDGLADARRRVFDTEPAKLHVTAVEHFGLDLASGFDVVAPDPAQGRAKQGRRKIAPPRSHRSGRQRCSDQSNRRVLVPARNQLRQIGPPRHALTVATRLA